MNGQKLFDGLQLHDQLVFNQKVNPVSTVDRNTLITDRQQQLRTARHAPLFHLNFKARLIRRLQQTWAQKRMNPECGIDDHSGKIIQFLWNFLVHLGALGVLVVSL